MPLGKNRTRRITNFLMKELIPNKKERRILAAEQAGKLAWRSLAAHLKFKALRKQATTGHHLCACGKRISANKPGCAACLQQADPRQVLAA